MGGVYSLNSSDFVKFFSKNLLKESKLFQMLLVYKQEGLKHKYGMISRICEIAVYSPASGKFYYIKYRGLPNCKCIDSDEFHNLMKRKTRRSST